MRNGEGTCTYEEVHNLPSSPNSVGLIKQRKTRWMECLGRMMETRKASKFWSGNLSFGDQGVDMRTVGLDSVA
jgi:hypothetical protein